ncbi:MAG: hypothetical protein ISR47_03635 [Rhodospirillales bacterium]|nr:hypothetical protein [Rhodospirillales bacterium]
MGGIDPISLAVTAAGMAAARQKSKRAASTARQNAELQARQIRERQAMEARRAREALKKQTATQRARFGASGAGGSGGSGDALLKGLADETERGIDDMYKLNKTKLDGIYQNYANKRRQNLLEASRTRRNGLVTMLDQSTGLSQYFPKFNLLKDLP